MADTNKSNLTAKQEQQLVRFANALRAIPHRDHCQRTKGTSHKCSCDVGEKITPIYNQFLEAMGMQ